MMADAICLRCGAPKKQAWHRCRRCRFDPKGDRDALVKSVYLSVGRYEDDARRDAYRVELDQVRRELEAGTPPVYDDQELARLEAQRRLTESVTRGELARYLGRVLLVPVLVVGAGLLALWGLAAIAIPLLKSVLR